MVTKYEKANRSKLLIAIMAMVMIFAGAAVVLSDSETMAAEGGDEPGSDPGAAGNDGELGLENTINADITITDKAYLRSNLTIPQGKTLTIKSTGYLDMKEYDITVEGKLVIERNGVVTIGVTTDETPSEKTNSIVLTKTGVIDNKGIIGKESPVTITGQDAADQSISMKGVSGVSVELKRVSGGTTYYLGISGTVSKISGISGPELTVTGVTITEDLTISKDVKFTVDGNTTVAKNVTVDNKGTMTVESTAVFELLNGSKLIASNGVSGAISAKIGYVGDNDTITKDGTVTSTVSTFEFADVKGLTISVSRSTVAVDDTESAVFQGMYINGTTSRASKVVSGETPAPMSVAFTSTDGFKAFIDGNLIITKDVAISGDFDVSKSGMIQVNEGANAESLTFTGASYAVETTVDGATVMTDYYTNFDAAMGVIGTAFNNEISVSGTFTIDSSYTIAADQIISVYGTTTPAMTVGKDSVITVEEDGSIDNGIISKINGKVIVKDGGNYTPAPGACEVVTSDRETNTVIYSGFELALSEATPGSIIDVVGSPVIDGSMSITSGVTVNVADGNILTVKGNITIAEGGKLVLDDATLIAGDEGKESTITVNGELDASEGIVKKVDDADAKVNLYSTGKTVIGAEGSDDTKVTVNAASYMDGETVYTSLSKAIEYAMENGLSTVTVIGNVSDSTAVTSEGVNIVIDGVAKLGQITLDGANISVSSTDTDAKYTATVSGLTGEGDAAVKSTVSVTETTMTIDAKTTVNSSGVNVYAFTINKIYGTIVVSEGTVAFAATITSSTNGSKLTVSSGATLLIDKDVTIDGKDVEFVANGDVIVKKAKLTFSATGAGKTPVIAGQMTITDNGTVEANVLSITGTVTVAVEENKKNTFEIKTTDVSVGSPMETIGATGAIVGDVNLATGKYIVAFAGSDMSGAKINFVNGETSIVSTQYTVNGIAYATVFAEKGQISIETPITKTMIEAIKGIDKTKLEMEWTDADGNVVNKKNVGDVASANIKVAPSKTTITVSYGTGISLWIDGVHVNNNVFELVVGEHTVTATVNPGYTGDVTIMFNGQTVTDGKIDVTADMDKTVVLSATGNIVIDGGSTGGDNNGMGLVEILLIVLVVMVVILAIVVILRMMRS